MSQHYVLKEKVAIVTGGGKGLGKSLTLRLLQEGMKVAICGRTPATITNTVAELKAKFGERIYGQVCDISDASAVSHFIGQVRSQFGDIQVLVNNSGFGKETLICDTSESDWDDVMDTNVKGTFLMCKNVVPNMIKQKEGYVVNIASQAALNGYPNAGVYCASKFAMVGLGKALQEEVHEYGIHVHSLNPALIQSQKAPTDEINTGLIQNDDLSDMLVYLLQQPRRLKIDNIGMWGF
ncbi:SDR family oxidoreductase [Alteromonas lipotrueae]|uniref:SDR family oxidoreductase n=1 Tax=Alteromonas lipotrueae TaxID=2803814 RepID=UPI001C45EBD9|nr:SDR family oxidoreductase [Alteromonas lipotrueae]